jgi:glutaconyl-CoA decarboxylase
MTAPVAPAAPASGGSGTVTAPIPGVVTKVLVSAGDTVTAGQVVLKLEAMKMENDIATPVAGTVKQVSVADGTEVKDGQLLLVVE